MCVCSSFKVGRVGDETMFAGSVIQGGASNLTGTVCSLFLFAWVSPSMANRDPAILAAQEAKVQCWCRELEKTVDLAFFFTSEEEALREASRAVSEAWPAARSSSERCIAGLVRHLFVAEQRASSAAGPRPSVSPTLRPRSPPHHTWSARKVRKPIISAATSRPRSVIPSSQFWAAWATKKETPLESCP